jgi:hypothetical protein
MLPILLGCATKGQDNNLLGGFVGLGSAAPSSEIQQIYYLGVFDPRDQLPPTVYRVRVHGQASFISLAKFASGWVPASLIDSLTSSAAFEKSTGALIVSKADTNDQRLALQIGRRLMLFGPEGFREASADHRLVVVMGTSADDFFDGVSNALGIIAKARGDQQNNTGLDRTLFDSLVSLKAEQDLLNDLGKSIDRSLPAAGAGEKP